MIGHERGFLKRLRVRKKKGWSAVNQLVTHDCTKKITTNKDTFCVYLNFMQLPDFFRITSFQRLRLMLHHNSCSASLAPVKY